MWSFAWLAKKGRPYALPLAQPSKIHQSTIYYAGLLGRWDKGIVDQASDGPSIIFLLFFIK